MAGKQPYIFVSYAHKDSALVMPIIEGLQQKHFHVWYDTGIEAGTEWPEYIATKLLDSDCVIAFISENAMSSHNCRREINFAIAKDKDLLVVYLEDLELSPGMQMQLDVLQAMFYYRCPTLTTFVDELAKARLLERCKSEQPPEPPVRIPRMPEHLTDSPAPVPEAVPPTPEQTPEQMYQLGISFGRGDGVEQNPEAAAIWFQNAAKQDYAPAQFAAAECFSRGFGVPRNCKEAFTWYCAAAANGHPKAQVQLGQWYQNGVATPKDIGQAVRLYRQAALQGNAVAQFHLGLCHEKGTGVALSIVEAVKWYQASAQQNYAPAQHQLALCYERGSGVPKSTVQAARYYLAAAEQNYAPAQYNLSLCYEKGAGVPKDLNAARKWRSLSRM